MLIKISLNLRDDQINQLTKLPGQSSEHIRQAIDDYLEKKRGINAITSLSERRKNGNN